MTSETTISSDGVLDLREFHAGTLAIVTSDGGLLDIRAIVLEVEIRQDMYLGYMNGTIAVVDGTDLISQHNIHGGEYVFVNFRDPLTKRDLIKTFRIYKISGRSLLNNNNQKYLIHIVSEEMFNSNTKRISKAYKGARISDIASDVMINYMNIPESKVNIDPTTEPVDLILPSIRPTECMNFLASRAFADNDKYCYFFYENLNGYNFKSLHRLYDVASINESTPYQLQAKSVDKSPELDTWSIDAFTVKKDFDTITGSNVGAYAYRFLGLDLFHNQFVIDDVSAKDIPKLYENVQMDNQIDMGGKHLFEKYDSYQLVYPRTEKTKTEPNPNRSEVWLKRVMSMGLMNNHIVEIVVPGNFNLTAGCIVSVDFMHMIAPTEKDMRDSTKSGKYFVTAVNHRFDIQNSKYDTVFLMTRDSVPEPAAYDPDLLKKVRKMENE